MNVALKPLQRALLALLSIVLLSLGWLRVSGLTLLVGLVPLLLISASYDASRRSFWRMFGWSALVMGGWTVATCWWIYYAAAIGIVAATIVAIILFGGVVMLYHYFSKRAKPSLAYLGRALLPQCRDFLPVVGAGKWLCGRCVGSAVV